MAREPQDPEIHAVCVRHGRIAKFPRDALLAAFEGHVRDDDGTLIQVEIREGAPVEIHLSGTEQIEDFTVSGNLGDPALHAALLALMRIFDIVLYRPGGGALLMGREEVRAHVPPDMSAKLGNPRVANHPWEIRAAVTGA